MSQIDTDAKRKKSKLRWAKINGFIDVTMRDLDRSEIAVWLILFRDAKGEATVKTSQSDLANRAGVDDRTVRRALAKLIEAGLVKVVKVGGIGRGPSVYAIRGTT